MKRMISLTALMVCCFTISFGTTQTWRLTNNSNNDNKPHIELTNSGKVWVIWLSDEDGDYDVQGIRYNTGAWETEFKFNDDTVNQTTCDIARDSLNASLFIAWDSIGQVQVAHYMSGWYTTNVSDSARLLCSDGDICITAINNGVAYVGWSSPVPYSGWGYQVQGNLKTYNGTTWDTTETVFTPCTTSDEDSYYIKGIAAKRDGHPNVLGWHWWDGLVYFSYGGDILFTNWQGDSVWYPHCVDSWQYPHSKDIGIAALGGDTLLISYWDNTGTDSAAIICICYTDSTFTDSKKYQIIANQKFNSGAVYGLPNPTIVWSDSQRIYASAFYDTMWSTIPKLISDSSLTSCINPDVVVENDSTMWVCYECDNEIYVTKTSVPLGVTGDRPEPNKIAVKPYIQAYPNPASNRVNISYNNNSPAVISIYDITGGRIRALTANNGQVVWDCRNGQGRQVSSGVYFIRARQDNNEIIKKINIVR